MDGRGPQQVAHVEQVGEHLAVVRGRAFVVAAVGEHLYRQLAGEVVAAEGQQVAVAEEHAEADEGLQVLDEVVAADIELDVGSKEAGVHGKLVHEGVVEVAACDQRLVHAAEGPGAQRRRVRMPRVAPAER